MEEMLEKSREFVSPKSGELWKGETQVKTATDREWMEAHKNLN